MVISIKHDGLPTQCESGLGGVGSNLVIFNIIFLSLSISCLCGALLLCVVSKQGVSNNSHTSRALIFGNSL